MSTTQEVQTTGVDAAEAAADRGLFSFTAEAFFKMIEADVFADDERVELWDGQVHERMAKKRPHFLSSAKVDFALQRLAPPGWFVGGEGPIKLNQVRVPLPDLVILRGVFDDYVDRDPSAADVGLVVELSDSSLRYDTTIKLAAYAEAGIPAYWVVNLIKNVIQTYETPISAERRYAEEAVYAVGQSVPLRSDGVIVAEIAALDLLPIRA